ncbi:hypothetical protein Tcur_0036 [Thermomonospora curvata DSM 43183]|uniref:Uncharacterized protein n=1 Tax=Thermomonospora curvata (strain ATCC 19995 / DSM 43183 / JCM 3096 / KCTC 9072 / NBRC 15933 / NCIMB 10081 / Henssen B9) TaxID=471852 RepID=D1ADD4_THECD|nr:hypothetical protein Tcur_0036 [Thermomonospora curvata DSM 43183]
MPPWAASLPVIAPKQPGCTGRGPFAAARLP